MLIQLFKIEGSGVTSFFYPPPKKVIFPLVDESSYLANKVIVFVKQSIIQNNFFSIAFLRYLLPLGFLLRHLQYVLCFESYYILQENNRRIHIPKSRP